MDIFTKNDGTISLWKFHRPAIIFERPTLQPIAIVHFHPVWGGTSNPYVYMDVEPKIGGFDPPKMDGENNGSKPY